MAELSHKVIIDTNNAQASLTDLGNQVLSVDKIMAGMAKDGTKYLAQVEAQIRENTQKQKEHNQHLKDMMQIMAATGPIGKFAGSMTSVKTALLSVADGAKQVIDYNIETAKQFEQTMHYLGSITRGTAEDMDYFSSRAIELGAKTTQTASQVAEAFKIVAQKSPQLLESGIALTSVTDKAITLAQAAGIDVPEAATALTNVLNQFQFTAADAGYIIDVLAKGSQVGAGSIEYLSSALVQCGSVAKSVGVTFEETVAILEQLAQGGFQPGQAGRMTKNILILLETKQKCDDLKPSVVGVQTALENLAKASLDTEGFKKIFGRENIAAAQYLSNNIHKMHDMLIKLSQSQGVAVQQSDNNIRTYAGSVKILESEWEALNLSINQSNGFLRGMADGISGVIRGIRSMIDEQNRYNKALWVGNMLPNQWKGKTKDLTEEDKAIKEKFDEDYSNVRGTTKERKQQQEAIANNAYKEALNHRMRAEEKEDAQRKVILQKIAELEQKYSEYEKMDLGTTNEALFTKNASMQKIRKEIDSYKTQLGELRMATNSAIALETYIEGIKNGYDDIIAAMGDVINEPDGPTKPTTTKQKTEGEKFDEISATYKSELNNLALYEEEVKKRGFKTEDEQLQHTGEMYKKRLKIVEKYYEALEKLDFTKVQSEKPEFFDTFFDAKKAYNEQKSVYDKYNADIKAKEDTKKQIHKKAAEIPKPQTISKNQQNADYRATDYGYDQINLTEVTEDYVKQYKPKKSKKAASYFKGLLEDIRSEKDNVQKEIESMDGLDLEGLMSQFKSDPAVFSDLEKLSNYLDEIKKKYNDLGLAQKTVEDNTPDTGPKEAKKWTKNLKGTAGAFGDLANAIGNFSEGSTDLKVAMTVISTAASIAQLIASFAAAMNSPVNTMAGPWAWIAASVAGTAQLVAMVAQISAIKGYAQGGIVGGYGNMQVGDHYLARLNGGEAVLTKSDQSKFMKLLDGGGYYGSGYQSGDLSGEIRIKGSDLYVALSNYNKIKPGGLKF